MECFAYQLEHYVGLRRIASESKERNQERVDKAYERVGSVDKTV